MRGRLELLVGIPVTVGFLGDDAALLQHPFQHQFHMELRYLGTSHKSSEILEFAKQSDMQVEVFSGRSGSLVGAAPRGRGP